MGSEAAADQATMIELLEHLAQGLPWSAAQAEWFFGQLMAGQADPVVVASVLTALRVRGETVDELVGAATAMRQVMTRPPLTRAGLLDTCGTGGDGAGTFNISTAAAIVVSACGVPVAKHGNRSVSSRTGSADVLEALGVNTAADPAVVAACVEQIGLGFFFAPAWHPAMKHAMPVRRALRFRTIFNLLGPLCNPAGAEFQLIGVGDAARGQLLAAALARLGTQAATVVSGSDGLDEVTLTGPTAVAIVRHGQVESATWTPADFGLSAGPLDPLRVPDAAASAAMIRAVLAGEQGPARDMVLLNAAAALWTARGPGRLPEFTAQAAAALDSGHARMQLDALVSLTRG